MGWFGPKLPIDADELEWQFAGLQWMISEFGELGPDTPLVLPGTEWFPPSSKSGHPRAEELFDQVRHHAGLEQWECELKPGARNRPVDAGNTHLLRHEGPSAPSGTFQLTGEEVTRVAITYNPDLVGEPMALVATFAHELSHYLLFSAQSVPPGGWDLHELHTDLCAVYLGFGIFLANSARNFRQFQGAGEQGWSASTQGYLSEGALVTALAATERLASREPLGAEPYLKSYLQADLRKASKALAKLHPDIHASVLGVDLSEYRRE